MNTRLVQAKDTHPTEHFDDLLLAGEMLCKLSVALLLASADEDTERQLYNLEWTLIRADSLGKWSDAGRELLTGPRSKLLCAEACRVAEQLTALSSGTIWYRSAYESLYAALHLLYPEFDKPPKQTSFVHWLLLMSELRNKTKHGAQLPIARNAALPFLEKSVAAVATGCPLFDWQLVHKGQELSGRMKTVPLTDPVVTTLTAEIAAAPFQPGVHLILERARPVRLLFSNARLDDFWFPNGNYKETRKEFEVLSYVTGDIDFLDGSHYIGVPAPLPTSATAASGELEARGNVLTNAPTLADGYIHRPSLEGELDQVLMQENRHSVVTLAGRGGIGKTSLALQAIDSISQREQFLLVIWFSARDIDLLEHGPKQVTPDVLTLDDVARMYKRIVGDTSKEQPVHILAHDLASCCRGPTLFVFDNFETVRSPDDFFRFIDERIRPPNKVLITTRHRSFKGDYAIDVQGMEKNECRTLINDHSRRLRIGELLTEKYKDEIIAESEGHPYVIKIILGEVAREGRICTVERIVAARDDILDAFFDRTYKTLSEAGKRVFLTLCAWNSTVPVAALEAVMLRNLDERIPVDAAIDELVRFSFIDLLESPQDQHLFVSVPLAASLFGNRRLRVSPDRAAVDADVQLLKEFGATQRVDVRHGIGPRILRMFRFVAQEIQVRGRALQEFEPMLQFLARKWPAGWLQLATLREEASRGSDIEGVKQALRAYLEVVDGLDAIEAWKRLADTCKQAGDLYGEVQALAEMAATPELPLREISGSVNRVNRIFRDNKEIAPTDERRIILRRFIDVMASRTNEASADDLSRLAWLYLQLNEEKRAYEVASLGSEREPENHYCQKIKDQILANCR
jgi:hypothetical protein